MPRPPAVSPTFCQFPPLREGRLPKMNKGSYLFYFNSRPSARGDGLYSQSAERVRSISIHAPPRGATSLIKFSSRSPIYFNSRPSARGDVNLMANNPPFDISIHAPPRGATQLNWVTLKRMCKFQFTPLCEGRPEGWEEVRVCENFNSRPSARGDFQRIN